MKPRVSESFQSDMFRLELINIINLRHELVKLADAIDWKQLTNAFEPLYCEDNGRPGCSIRLMCVLQYLKHM